MLRLDQSYVRRPSLIGIGRIVLDRRQLMLFARMVDAPDSSIERTRFFTYRCRNCGESLRIIAIILDVTAEDKGDVQIMKLGEYPPFGAPIAPRLHDLLGDEEELFRKAWNSERSGLGIGAAAYYRRIVERKWQALVQALKEAAVAVEADGAVIAAFDEALRQKQFSNLRTRYETHYRGSSISPVA